jgi:signal transduction histidine kinase
VDNAVKYLDPKKQGEIRISAKAENGRVVYCVSDNGIGIDKSDQEKIFEIFTRLAEKAHAGGEGMGLTMVKRMVDRNGGEIWIESEKGKGSKFFVALPSRPTA